MGNCRSLTEDEKRNQEINKQLRKDAKVSKELVKLLLLGSGESGKSTIFKQMKILQLGGGFNKQELEGFKPVIYSNLITQMKVLVNASEKLEYHIREENRVYAQKVLDSKNVEWSEELGHAIKNLWNDNAIRITYSKKDSPENHNTIHFHLNDSAAYFFDNIDRYLDPNYIPTEQDALRARVRSTGIEEAVFRFQDLSFRMVDVGGQRSERRKWIHCFGEVTAILFVSSLSEYDQFLREEDSQPRMHESLLLFDEICNSVWFSQTAIILFLNKEDIFRQKIKKVDLSFCFEDYDGGDDYNKALDYIRQRFLEKNNSQNSNRKIYVHVTCAVNTENVEFVFNSVRRTLLEEILGEFIPISI